MRRRVRASTAVAMSATLTLTTVGSLAAQSEADPAPDPDDQPTLTGRIDTALAARADALDGDVAAVTKFVADHVRSEAYDGVFKGARGAYLTGAANSTDQALLAAALLTSVPDVPPIRFAHCALDEIAGGMLATEWATEPVPGPDFDYLDVLEEIDNDELRTAIEDVLTFYEETTTQAEIDAAALATHLEAAGWEAADPAGSASALTGHVWLQVKQDGAWVDADSSTADGTPPCAATETFESLPSSMDHQLTIRVIAEHLTAGALAETVLLDQSQPMADLATARTAFAFGEPAGLVGAGRSADGAWTYTPVLRMDNETITGEPLLLPAILSTTASAFDSATEGLGGLLGGESEESGGGLFGSDEPAGEAPEVGTPTAAWLEIEHAQPAGDPLVVRSEVFDRIGPAARAGDAGKLTPAEFSTDGNDYVALQSLWQIGLLQGASLAAEGVPSLDGVLLTSFDGHSGHLDNLLRSFVGWQGDWRGVPGVPTILLLGLETIAGETEASSRTILDALHVPGPVPADATEAAQAAYSVMVAETMLRSAVADGAEELGNVADVFAAARTAETPVVTVRHGAGLDTVAASHDALERLGERIAAGYTAIVPASAPVVGESSATGWFLLDPSSGLVRDEHESGRHVEYGERGATEGAKKGLVQNTWNSACRLGRNWGMAIMLTAVVVSPTGGDNAVTSAIRQGAEQQRRLNTARAAACGEAGQG